MDHAWPHDGLLPPTRPDREGRRAFDLWLQDELVRRYGAPVQAPLPEDLRRLVEAP